MDGGKRQDQWLLRELNEQSLVSPTFCELPLQRKHMLVWRRSLCDVWSLLFFIVNDFKIRKWDSAIHFLYIILNYCWSCHYNNNAFKQTYEILLLVLALALTHLGTKHELISFGCQCIFTLLRLLILLAVPLWTKSKVRLLSGTHWYNHWGQASRPLSVICGSEVDMWVINHVCYSLSKVQQEH